MSRERTTYRARLDRGVARFVTAGLLLLPLAGAWYHATTAAPGWVRPLGILTPAVLALSLLALALRRELSVGRYGLEIALWPVPVAFLRLSRPEILVVAIVKRTRWWRKRVVWDVVVQTRQGVHRLTRNHADDEVAEREAAKIRAALS
jgi:hypothetical protein